MIKRLITVLAFIWRSLVAVVAAASTAGLLYWAHSTTFTFWLALGIALLIYVYAFRPVKWR